MKLRKVVSTGAMSVGALLLSFSLPAFAAGDEPDAATASVSAADPTCDIDILGGCIDIPTIIPTTPAPTDDPTGPTVGPTTQPTDDPTGPTSQPTTPQPTNDPDPTDDPTGPTVAPTNGGSDPDDGVADAGAGAGAAQADENLGGFVADAQATPSTGTGSGTAASGDNLPETGVSDQLNTIAITGAALLIGGAMLVIRRPHLARHKR